MRRNCNLELRLLPSSSSSSFFSDNQNHRQTANMKDESTSESSPSQQQLKQQLTIFYNGNMCVYDVTELQARAMLFYASREMEEKMMTMKTPKGSDDDAEYSPAPTPTPTGSSTSTVVQMSSPTAASLSMKRSLQRFLQKRKHRVHAATPYHH